MKGCVWRKLFCVNIMGLETIILFMIPRETM